jgi:hypothetical protein
LTPAKTYLSILTLLGRGEEQGEWEEAVSKEGEEGSCCEGAGDGAGDRDGVR